MSENSFWFTKALYFMDHITRLSQNDWDRPSPCEGWTARHVLGHVIAIQQYYVSAIDGRPPTMDPMNAPDRHAGAEPARSWGEARDAVLRALDRPGVLDLVVPTVEGEQRVDDLIAFNVVDTTVHSWDLAQAFAIDDSLDSELVARSLDLVEAAESALSGSGVYGTPVPVAALDGQTRLLAALGRRRG